MDQETADLVTFTEEILNTKLHFLCSVKIYLQIIEIQRCHHTLSVMQQAATGSVLKNFGKLTRKHGTCAIAVF